MDRPIRAAILCTMGTTSRCLAEKIQTAAGAHGIPLQISAASVAEFEEIAPELDVLLLEPQVRHHQKSFAKTAALYGLPLAVVEPRAFATMNGDRVLQQMLDLLKRDA
ncbi:PTS sugar transporter subunit IIB [Marinithermofilum abyssi]|nr:PTS sugar transporter subunit IIB [Marinithermofilum abyssi]